VEVLDHKFATAGALRRLATFMTVGLAAALLSGCAGSGASSCGTDRSGLPTCSVPASAVASRPEASLSYPESTVISHNVQGQQNFIGQTDAANASTRFATTAPIATVYAWYATWLTQHGWHVSPVSGLGPIEVSAQAYRHGAREQFFVAEDSLNLAHILRYRIPAALQSETLYETTYLINPSRAA
jgi:hypothetical protein